MSFRLLVILVLLCIPSLSFADRYDLSKRNRAASSKARDNGRGVTLYGGCITQTRVEGNSRGQTHYFVVAGRQFSIGPGFVRTANNAKALDSEQLKANQQLWDQILLAVELKRQVLLKVRGKRALDITFQWDESCQTFVQKPVKRSKKTSLPGVVMLDVGLGLPFGEVYASGFSAWGGMSFAQTAAVSTTARIGLYSLNSEGEGADFDGRSIDLDRCLSVLMLGVQYSGSLAYLGLEAGPSLSFASASVNDDLSSETVEEVGVSFAVQLLVGLDFGPMRLSTTLLIPDFAAAEETVSATLNLGVDFE